MRLSIENVGILSKVDLEINGITVIAGENDTGKSTVSKSLYAMFNGFYKLEEKIVDAKIEDIEEKISVFLERNFDIYVYRRRKYLRNRHIEKEQIQELLESRDDINENQVVYDLYTGTGTIAQYIARHAKQVIGIEAVPEAIDAAKEKAKLNDLDNCIFYCGDMKEVFTEEFLAQHPKADVLITDPPRDGMHPKVVEQILKLSPNRIVYVSCNSATQARDLALMKDFYKVEKILPVDMFPQTHHVENIALLTKK